jgi:hypothetical protein
VNSKASRESWDAHRDSGFQVVGFVNEAEAARGKRPTIRLDGLSWAGVSQEEW